MAYYNSGKLTIATNERAIVEITEHGSIRVSFETYQGSVWIKNQGSLDISKEITITKG